MASICRPVEHAGMNIARLLAVGVLVLIGSGGAGAAVPSSFHLVFDGRHNAALLHEGTFTTSSSWCRSGTAADTAIDEATLTATRVFRCAGGGDFTAKVTPLNAEHGGIGAWQIVAGSGTLADLRGEERSRARACRAEPTRPPSPSVAPGTVRPASTPLHPSSRSPDRACGNFPAQRTPTTSASPLP